MEGSLFSVWMKVHIIKNVAVDGSVSSERSRRHLI
jgi:hypothetical protein